MNFPWPRIWSIACPTFPASATKAMPHTRSASSSGTRPAIPAKSNEAPVACPSWIYNNRNRVERLWARLKEWRNPLRENRQILHGRPLPCRHLRLDQERLQAITGPSVLVQTDDSRVHMRAVVGPRPNLRAPEPVGWAVAQQQLAIADGNHPFPP